MSNIVVMPKLGLTMESGVITRWAVKEGEPVKRGDILLELESDKSTVDLESEFEGILLKQFFAEGIDVKCGDKVALIGNVSEKVPEIFIPKATDTASSTTELKEEGLSFERKPNHPSPDKGFIRQIASPRARRFARNNGIDISYIENGSGENNRIVESDVKAYLETGIKAKERKLSPVARSISEAYAVSTDGMKGSGPEGRIMKEDIIQVLNERSKTDPIHEVGDLPKKVPLTKMRSIIARRLSDSKKNTPHYYMSISIDMESFIRARTLYNSLHPEKKVSMNAMLMKVVAADLMKNTDVNSSWADDGIIHYPHADVALAVASETGLITPVVRKCEKKGVLEIDKELDDLISRARKSTLSPDEYSNQTCTVSNLGMYGIEDFCAIINPPAASIIAISATINTPVAVGQMVAIKPMMKVTMSGDHRVIDGAVGAQFMKDLKLMLEEPFFGMF